MVNEHLKRSSNPLSMMQIKLLKIIICPQIGKSEHIEQYHIVWYEPGKKGTLIYCWSETIKTTLENNLALPGKVKGTYTL